MKKGWSILGIAVLLVILVFGVWLLTRRDTAARSQSGTIETDEVHLASRYGGRVEKIFADEGDALKPGDLLMELDAKELQAHRDQAAAALDESQHGPRPAEIAAASNDWQSVIAQLTYARAEEKRSRELFAQRVISATERDQTASRARELARSAAAAHDRYTLLAEGTRPEQIEQARAQLAELDAQLREMQIRVPNGVDTNQLPVTGTDTPAYILEVLSVKVGDVLPANREVATLLMTQHLWVRVYVPETWLGFIQLGQVVQVSVDSFPGRTFQGTVEQVNRGAEFTPRNVQTVADRIRQVFGVKIRLPTEGGLLRAGMSADVSFPNVPSPPK